MITDFLKKQRTFIKIEFWAFTTLFVFILFFFITDGLDGPSAIEAAPHRADFEKANLPFSYYKDFFVPQLIHNIVLFAAFLSLNFFIIPKLMNRKAVWKNLLFLALIFLVCAVVFGIANSYIKGYLYAGRQRDEIDQKILLDGLEYTFLLFILLTVYTIIKYTGLYLLAKSEAIHNRFPFITREAIVATFIWLVILLLFWIGGADIEVTLAWSILIGYGIWFYSYSFYKVIPKALTKKRPLLSYLLRSALITALLFFPLFWFLLLLLLDWKKGEDLAFNVITLNTVFQVFVTVPLTWLLYKRQQKGNEEVIVLKKELKRSTANIDFLRSQINPHFLFNALNTLYGTAIQENAERTRGNTKAGRHDALYAPGEHTGKDLAFTRDRLPGKLYQPAKATHR
jgi:two-component system, LytTR family, sensor kinase